MSVLPNGSAVNSSNNRRGCMHDHQSMCENICFHKQALKRQDVDYEGSDSVRLVDFHSRMHCTRDIRVSQRF